jgi:hypothetical protein
LETIPEEDKQVVNNYFKTLAHGCSENEKNRKDWISFLTWLLSTTLTGEVIKFITFLYGPGANNGKTKILELMKKLHSATFYTTPRRNALVTKDAKGRI